MPAGGCDPATSNQAWSDNQTSAWRGPPGRWSVLEILATWCAAWIARQKAEDEDADEKEDDRVNGDLEGEHGDRPASGIAPSSYGSRL